MKALLKSIVPDNSRIPVKARAICASPECYNKQLASWIPGVIPGIQVGDRWFCCVDCLVLGIQTQLEMHLNRPVLEARRRPRLPLNLVLFSKGYLTAEQLRKATAFSEEAGEDLEVTLLRLDLVNEKQLAAARAAQWGYPMLSTDQAGHWVETDLPTTLFRAFRAVPLHRSIAANRILLGFVSHVELQLLETIERLTSLRVEPCFITASEWQEQLERVTAARGYEELFMDGASDSNTMARTMGRAAVKAAAREAVLLRCKDYLVARLAGKRGIVDVVFHIARPTAPARHKYFDQAAERMTVAV